MYTCYFFPFWMSCYYGNDNILEKGTIFYGKMFPSDQSKWRFQHPCNSYNNKPGISVNPANGTHLKNMSMNGTSSVYETFNTHVYISLSNLISILHTNSHFSSLYCCSDFFITIISTYRSPLLASLFAPRLSLSGCRSHVPYNSLSPQLWLCKLLPLLSLAYYCIDGCSPPDTHTFVTLYKVKRSMKRLLICKWASVKDRDSPLSETPHCSRVVKMRLIWTLNKRCSLVRMHTSGLFWCSQL